MFKMNVKIINILLSHY